MGSLTNLSTATPQGSLGFFFGRIKVNEGDAKGVEYREGIGRFHDVQARHPTP